jgi:hypothetical protein
VAISYTWATGYKAPSGLSLLRSDSLMMARREAGSCGQRPNSGATLSDDAQMRVGKQLVVAKKPNRKWQGESLNKSQLTLSRGD